TGDFGILSKEKCPCGRTLPLLSLEGRPIEYIDLPGNKKVHVFELFSILYQYEAIKMFQIVQDSLHKIRVLIVPTEKWNEDLAVKIKSFFYAHLPGIKKVDVDMVPFISADPEKKRKILIKNI
ncbi:MAG: hypothetical protein HY432_03530, partial [Candidatus Liptonbacteria bacterium]|nr:hypothetical protein [Candidatus Liptonbacteria bacterium]